MKGKYSLLLFFLSFLIILAEIDTINSLSKRPQAIHLWSQADRASVALNYAQDDMNFFKPRVHFTKQDNGVTGIEFPFMNYLAAICYKIFGFNEFWYRLLMLLVVSSGIIAAFVFSGKLTGNNFIGTALVLLWFLSPTLAYYTPNFIPDAASLGFILVAWLFYFRYDAKNRSSDLILFILFASLATLIKITSLISIITILGIISLRILRSLRNKENQSIRSNLILLAGCIFVFIPVYSWYHYADYLNQVNQHGIFTLDYHPVTSLGEFKDITISIYHQWFFSYYSPVFYAALLFSAAFILVNFRKADKKLLLITSLLYVGNLCFILLMFKQFRDHDYYIITLLPAPLFQLITAGKILFEKNYSDKTKLVIKAIFIVIIGFSAIYARKDTYKRYHGWQYDKNWDYKAFYGMDHYLRTLGINKDDKVIVIYDGSFDVSLYLMNVKGWTMWPGNDESKYFEEAIKYKVGFIILRNPGFLTKSANYSKYFNHLIGNYNGISVYKIDYDN